MYIINIDKEIQKDKRIEEIFRNIESELINEEVTDSILQSKKTLLTCLKNIGLLRDMYTAQQQEFYNYRPVFIKEGAKKESERLYGDLTKMIIDINEYEKILHYIINLIEDSKSKLEDQKAKIKKGLDDISKAYEAFIETNKDAIIQLEQIKVLSKQ